MKYLEHQYGSGNVIRQSTSREWGDFHCLTMDEDFDGVGISYGNCILDAVVECKSCRKTTYYPSPRDKEQFRTIAEWCTQRNINFYLFVHYPRKREWWYYKWKDGFWAEEQAITISPKELGIS